MPEVLYNWAKRFGSSPTARRTEAEVSSTTTGCLRQTVLGSCQAIWSGWKQSLILVSPETVVRWHRAGFALYGKAISRVRRASGRKCVSKEVRGLIFRGAGEANTWEQEALHGYGRVLLLPRLAACITAIGTSRVESDLNFFLKLRSGVSRCWKFTRALRCCYEREHSTRASHGGEACQGSLF
jgi:hypothetical protein